MHRLTKKESYIFCRLPARDVPIPTYLRAWTEDAIVFGKLSSLIEDSVDWT